MRGVARGIRVQVYLGESDQLNHTPRYTALLEWLRKEGAAGATVTRGIAGFGVNSKIRTSQILSLSMDLPVIVTWIDSPERVERLLPGVRERAGSGVIVLDDVRVAGYGGRGVDQLRFDLQARDAMRTDLVSIADDAPIREAVEALIGREFRALPVTDAIGKLRGIIANTDLIERGGLPVRLELLGAMDPPHRSEILATLPEAKVRDVMAREIVTLASTDSLSTAARRMAEHRLKRLPVVDGDGRLLGILSRADVLRAVAESFPREADAHEEHPGAVSVSEIMRTDAPTVRDTAGMAEVVDVVASTRLNRAIVVDRDDRVVGIISDADVLRSAEASSRPGVVGALMRAGTTVSGGSRSMAAEVMHPDPPTVTPDATIAEAAQVMVNRRRKILPVVDATGVLVGVVDRADLLHAASHVLGDATGLDNEDDED